MKILRSSINDSWRKRFDFELKELRIYRKKRWITGEQYFSVREAFMLTSCSNEDILLAMCPESEATYDELLGEFSRCIGQLKNFLKSGNIVPLFQEDLLSIINNLEDTRIRICSFCNHIQKERQQSTKE